MLRAAWKLVQRPAWASNVLQTIQDRSIKQLLDAYVSDAARHKGNRSHVQNIGYRSLQRNYTEVIILEGGKKQATLHFESHTKSTNRRRAECMMKLGKGFKELGGIVLQDKPAVIDRLLREEYLVEDAKIHWDKRVGSFHLIYTYEIPKLEDPDPAFLNKRIVACDPGIRPFQEFYSPTSGEYGELLSGKTTELMDRCKRLDKLHSMTAKHQGGRTRSRRRRQATRRRFRKKCAKERRRLTNWVQAAHYDAAKFILSKYDIVIQPKLEVARLSGKEQRNIQSRTVRAMYTWSHYRYRQRLKSASARYAGRHIIESREPGTSKTCTNCGFWHQGLQTGDKLYSCPRCRIVVDRQLAGARNNFFSEYGRAVGVGWDGVE